jgi:hypothetical protein
MRSPDHAARIALRQFQGRGFGWYTPQHITAIYAEELPQQPPVAPSGIVPRAPSRRRRVLVGLILD